MPTANTGKLSTLAGTPTNIITDKVDSPHAGLFMGLHNMAQGNYALKDAATLGFAHTFTDSSGTIQVALSAGKVLVNGEYIAVDALSATSLTKPASGALYHWAVASKDGADDGTGTASILLGTVDGVVPELTADKVPISLIRVQSTDTHSTPPSVQYFTTSKTDNKVSIGHLDSNAYTPSMDVTSSNARTLFKNKIANADIRFTLADNTADERFEIYSDDDSDGDEGDTALFTVDGLGATTIAGALTLNTIANATGNFLVEASGVVKKRTPAETLSDIGGTALTGSSNNTITTVTGANAIQGEDHLTFDGSDLKLLEDVNDGNPSLSIGGADAEKLLIQSVFDSGAQTLDFVKFSTATASGAADKGKYIFDVDGTTIATIDDGGIDLASGKAFTVNGSAISGGGGAITALNNATENELVTVGATTTELDAESFLTFDATTSTLTIISEDADALIDPSLILKRDSGSPANADLIGEITFLGRNASDNADVEYASIHSRSVNVSDTDSAKESDIYFSQWLKDTNTTGQHTTVKFGSEELVFNNTGYDLDFRVESNSNANMLVVDAGNDRVGIGTSTPSTPFHVVGNTLIGSIIGTYGTAPRNLNLIGADAVMRVARTHASNAPAIELLQLSADGNTMESYWDIFTDADTFRFRTRIQGSAPSQSTNDVTVLTIKESNQNIGIGTTTPLNCLQINHGGGDEDNGIMIVREDSSTSDGDLLGGIGFDSTDGNVPSTVLESSAFIASIATEDHSTTDKGGNLKFGVSLIDEDDDTTSTILANVGPPDTTANATCHAGFNSRATTAVVGAATYAPTIGDSGTLVIFTNASSNLTLPSINNTTSVGVQFTVFNETSSAINGQIAVSNSASINGGAASALDDIESLKAATFVCSGNNTWIRIG